jgi:hypothetical protein
MFRFTRKPSSGSHNQYLAKITGLVQCRHRRRTDVVSVMAAYYVAITLTTSVRRTVPRLLSSGILYSHLQRVTKPDAVIIQFVLPKMGMLMLETCRGS